MVRFLVFHSPSFLGIDTQRNLADVSPAARHAFPANRFLIIGGARTGTPMHTDPNATSAWNTLLAGRKRWILFPPSPDTPDAADAYVNVLGLRGEDEYSRKLTPPCRCPASPGRPHAAMQAPAALRVPPLSMLGTGCGSSGGVEPSPAATASVAAAGSALLQRHAACKAMQSPVPYPFCSLSPLSSPLLSSSLLPRASATASLPGPAPWRPRCDHTSPARASEWGRAAVAERGAGGGWRSTRGWRARAGRAGSWGWWSASRRRATPSSCPQVPCLRPARWARPECC
jgi:hypothetical protein